MNRNYNYPDFSSAFGGKPRAMAEIRGSESHPNIRGNVWFYENRFGVLVVADIEGLPLVQEGERSPIFAFHIHEGSGCSGNNIDPFANARTHYNPQTKAHPYHAGDLPPLFGVNGNAFLCVLTDRFSIDEIINRTIIIHDSPDDFTTQPSGNSGSKIACGEIRLM